MFGDCSRNGGDILKNLARRFWIGKLESIRLVQSHHKLKGVHRIQTNTAGAEQRLVVAYFFQAGLKHEILNHEPFDSLFDCCRVIHHKCCHPPRAKRGCNKPRGSASVEGEARAAPFRQISCWTFPGESV